MCGSLPAFTPRALPAVQKRSFPRVAAVSAVRTLALSPSFRAEKHGTHSSQQRSCYTLPALHLDLFTCARVVVVQWFECCKQPVLIIGSDFPFSPLAAEIPFASLLSASGIGKVFCSHTACTAHLNPCLPCSWLWVMQCTCVACSA